MDWLPPDQRLPIFVLVVSFVLIIASIRTLYTERQKAERRVKRGLTYPDPRYDNLLWMRRYRWLHLAAWVYQILVLLTVSVVAKPPIQVYLMWIPIVAVHTIFFREYFKVWSDPQLATLATQQEKRKRQQDATHRLSDELQAADSPMLTDEAPIVDNSDQHNQR